MPPCVNNIRSGTHKKIALFRRPRLQGPRRRPQRRPRLAIHHPVVVVVAAILLALLLALLVLAALMLAQGRVIWTCRLPPSQ